MSTTEAHGIPSASARRIVGHGAARRMSIAAAWLGLSAIRRPAVLLNPTTTATS